MTVEANSGVTGASAICPIFCVCSAAGDCYETKQQEYPAALKGRRELRQTPANPMHDPQTHRGLVQNQEACSFE